MLGEPTIQMHTGTGLRWKPESWNTTVLEQQGLERKERRLQALCIMFRCSDFLEAVVVHLAGPATQLSS